MVEIELKQKALISWSVVVKLPFEWWHVTQCHFESDCVWKLAPWNILSWAIASLDVWATAFWCLMTIWNCIFIVWEGGLCNIFMEERINPDVILLQQGGGGDDISNLTSTSKVLVKLERLYTLRKKLESTILVVSIFVEGKPRSF